jgi:hypothetical protein
MKRTAPPAPPLRITREQLRAAPSGMDLLADNWRAKAAQERRA